MTKQSKIEVHETRVPLADLTLSELNPRQHVPPEDVIELAESILSAGLIQNMAGYAPENGNVEIVAGGRRLRALQYLAEQHLNLATTHPELTNPLVMLAPDFETAQAWATTENIARRDLHPAEEVRAYAKMEDAGATVPAIARAFTVSETHVYRRLALAHLPKAILDALAGDEITLSAAACFTICDDVDHSLAVLERVRGKDWSAGQVKRMLKPDSIKSTDRRAVFVGEAAYVEAGGTVSTDLFAEETLLDDPMVLEACFETALDAAATDVERTQGWKWVEPILDSYPYSYTLGLDKYGRVYPVPGELTLEQTTRYDELAVLAELDVLDTDGETELADLQGILDGDYTAEQRDHAGAFVYVHGHGELQLVSGLVRPGDRAAAVAAEILAPSAHERAKKPTSALSAKLADDLSRVVTGVRQQALLSDPDLILDLLAYQLSHDLHWRAPFGITTTDVPNLPSTGEDGLALNPSLTKGSRGDMYDKDLARSFRAFRSKGKDHVHAELIRCLAAQFVSRDEQLGTLVEKETKPNIRAIWTPTAANFFSRVNATYLEALWCELLDLKPDHPTATTFGKLKKADKAHKLEALFSEEEVRELQGLTKDQAKRVDTWLPEGMG